MNSVGVGFGSGKDGGGVAVEHTVRDAGIWRFEWHLERWDEEQVDFARRTLLRRGIEQIQDGWHTKREPLYAVTDGGRFEYLGEREVAAAPKLIPVEAGVTSAYLRKIVGDPADVVDVPGNLLVNEGIQRLLDLAIAAVSNQTASNAWTNTTSYIGVGDSSTAEAATQTELQAATNRFYKGMNATYPSRSAQTVSWQSDFTTTEANFAWAEWSVSAGATTASGAGFTNGTINLNRKVQSLGTKSSGTWTLTAQVTIS